MRQRGGVVNIPYMKTNYLVFMSQFDHQLVLGCTLFNSSALMFTHSKLRCPLSIGILQSFEFVGYVEISGAPPEK